MDSPSMAWGWDAECGFGSCKWLRSRGYGSGSFKGMDRWVGFVIHLMGGMALRTGKKVTEFLILVFDGVGEGIHKMLGGV